MMKNTKLGRNDLCHCGSGRKYKSCCLEVDELIGTDGDLFEQYNRLITSCKMKLDQEFGVPIKRVRHDLQRHFLQFSTEKELHSQHESIFSDWLWFDLLDENENSFAYNYLSSREYFPKPLQECMGALMLSYLSVYEPIAVEKEYLRVKDIFTEKENLVLLKEPFDGDISKKMMLLGRQLHFKEASVFSGMVLILDDDAGQKDFILKHMDFLKELRAETQIISTLKFNAEVLYGVFDHAYQKHYLPLADMQVYAMPKEERSKVLELLASEGSFQFSYDSGSLQWFTIPDQNQYLRIGVGEETLVCSADLLEDVLFLRSFAQKLLPESTPRSINSVFVKKAPDEDLVPLWFEVIKDRESERWLHSVHAELDQQTPLEILSQEGGSERLLQMLDTFAERSNGSSETLELIKHLRLRVK